MSSFFFSSCCASRTMRKYRESVKTRWTKNCQLRETSVTSQKIKQVADSGPTS